jgi:hypothetical protein
METRKELKKRLEAAEVWTDYVDLRQRLIKEGLTPAEARKQAVAEIDSRPPKPAAAPDHAAVASMEPAPAVDLPDFNGEVPNNEAVQWVGENLVKSNVRPEDAPSGLAWGLLQWARSTPANKTTFWGSLWSKLLITGTALQQKEDKARLKEGPCPTCGHEPEPPDRGTENALRVLKQFAEEADERQAEENAELAKQPDAARIGADRQKELRSALASERALIEDLQKLKSRHKRKEPETEAERGLSALADWTENHNLENRTEDLELAVMREPEKAIGSLEKAVKGTVWRQARWQASIDELSKEKAKK